MKTWTLRNAGVHPEVILAILGDGTMTEDERVQLLLEVFEKHATFTEEVARGEEE